MVPSSISLLAICLRSSVLWLRKRSMKPVDIADQYLNLLPFDLLQPYVRQSATRVAAH